MGASLHSIINYITLNLASNLPEPPTLLSSPICDSPTSFLLSLKRIREKKKIKNRDHPREYKGEDPGEPTEYGNPCDRVTVLFLA